VSLNWTKNANNIESAELLSTNGQPVGILELVLGWDQPETGGLLGRFKPKTDIDVSAIIFVDDEDVDYVNPKEHPSALAGKVYHHGDVKAGKGEAGGERISVRLTDLRREEDDITAIALTASCAAGSFDKIAGAACHIYDATRTDKTLLGTVRFSVSSGHSGALLGVLKRTTDGWLFTKAKEYGPGGNWRTLANLARGHVA
jgi:stress response protein SCP2